MLDLVGIIAANFLSLPGVLGMALGMLTRRPGLAVFLGALVGVFEVAVFAGFDFSQVESLEVIVSIVVGCIAGLVGCFFRRKGKRDDHQYAAT
jgi:LytS/YehU family sensor histidine kinase